MLNFIDYLKIPQNTAFVLVCVFFAMQGIGEFLEFKGKIVPEFLKIRKRIVRKKKEKEALSKLPDFLDRQESTLSEVATTLTDVKKLYKDIQTHYSEDNISKRDGWMKEVNEHIVDSEKRRCEQAKVMQEQAKAIQLLTDKLDKNNADTLKILIDNKRNYLLDFTSKAVDMNYPLSKEQYQRFFNVHTEYEQLIEDNGMINGQVDVAYDVVTRSFEERLKKHAFIEDSSYDS